jgi:hypothetical protein
MGNCGGKPLYANILKFLKTKSATKKTQAQTRNKQFQKLFYGISVLRKEQYFRSNRMAQII